MIIFLFLYSKKLYDRFIEEYGSPLCSGDVNGDGETNVGDAAYLVNYIFRGEPSSATICCLG